MTTRKAVSWITWALLFFGSSLSAHAQSAPDKKLVIRPWVGSYYHSNYLQAPGGMPNQDVWANTFRLEVSGELDQVRLGLAGYGVFDFTKYTTFESSPTFGGGLRMKEGRHSAGVDVRASFNRPGFFIGDQLDTSNLFRIEGEYGYRMTSDYEIKGLLEYYRQAYELSEAVDNHTRFIGGAVRYRGFGSRFSPEVGLRRGGQDAVDDNNDYSQTELLVTVRSAVSPKVYLGVRYRYRHRSYETTIPRESNFGRNDDRHNFRALVTIHSREDLSWEIYFARETADSIRTVRVFTTHSFGVALGFVL